MKNYRISTIENSNIRLLLLAAKSQNIAWTVVDDDAYKFLLEKKGKTHLLTAHTLGINSHEGILLSKDKYQIYNLLKKKNIPVLPKLIVTSIKDYLKNYQRISFPQVIKPSEGQKGRQVYLNIPDKKTALKALTPALAKYKTIIVEPYFRSGYDIRILLLNHQVIGISQRKPPEIIGDNKNTIENLIEKENQKRVALTQKIGQRLLNRIVNLPRINWYLEKQGLNLQTVLPNGKIQKLHEIPNYSAGGSVTTLEKDAIHKSFIALSEKISKIVGLTIVGIDFIIKDLKKKASPQNCAVLELNSDPGVRLHDLPNTGSSQHVAEKIIKYIFS